MDKVKSALGKPSSVICTCQTIRTIISYFNSLGRSSTVAVPSMIPAMQLVINILVHKIKDTYREQH